jgi:tetratricopeptide (TPR) repeat protein
VSVLPFALGVALAAAPLPGPAPAPAPAPEVQREGPADALLREAKTLRYAQRWYEAATVYRAFLAAYPGSPRIPDARFWLAAALESDQRWDEAADAYTEFLTLHPDQRMLGREARLNRVRCWGVRQGQAPKATPGLLEALKDPAPEVQVAAALQLAKAGDPRAVEGLKKGLALPSCADACSLALINMGVKPSPPPSVQGRFLVIRIKEPGKADTVTIRLALALARAVTNYLSDAQIKEARAKGIDLAGLSDQALAMPKGSVLFSVEDGKSSVQVTVE